MDGGVLPIYAVTPFTMLDFPGRTACIVWFSGCNMRCGYCHNPAIVRGKGRGDIGAVFDFLRRRAGLLDGVVLSGGEATLYPGLPAFVERVRGLGYAIKLDTNGTRPDIVRRFLEAGQVDYIALDYKAPPEKFRAVTGINGFDDFSQTLDILCTQDKTAFEVRTTVHTDLMDEDDVNAIIADLDRRGYNGVFYVQNFRSDNDRPTLKNMPPQKRALDLAAIQAGKNFTLCFRNFDTPPYRAKAGSMMRVGGMS